MNRTIVVNELPDELIDRIRKEASACELEILVIAHWHDAVLGPDGMPADNYTSDWFARLRKKQRGYQEEVRKETAREIFKRLIGYKIVDDGWSWIVSAEDIAPLAKEFGVEVSDE